MAIRESLPTLTEDDIRSQGERVTMPTPISAELLRQMMARADETPEASTAPVPGADEEAPEFTEMPADEQADVVDELVQSYLERLGPRTHVPALLLSPARLTEIQIDHWAGFILSLVDGATTIDEIIAAAPMPEHEALRIVAELQQRGVIEVRAPAAAPARAAAPTPPAPKAPRIGSALEDDGLTLDDIEPWT